MGLSQSINRRLILVEGETLATSLKILFAGKKKRRAFEFNKFGYYLDVKTLKKSVSKTLKKSVRKHVEEADVVRSCIDEQWYADVHQLTSSKLAMNHYMSVGRTHAFAPSLLLADADGKSLSNWAVEYLVRCGVKVGDTGEQPLLPDDSRAIDPFKIANPNGKKVAVVTAVFGGHDTLMPFDPAWSTSADFYAFSDRFFGVSSVWRHVHSPYHHADPRRKARFIKLNLPIFFQEYEWVMWVDGNVLICKDPDAVITDISDETTEFAVFSHSQRNCIMAEAEACVLMGKDDANEVAMHLAQSAAKVAFRSNKLFETMVMVLQPSSPSVQKLFVAWWRLLVRGSKRDQLSLPLAMAEVPEVRFAALADTIEQSSEFFRTKHSVKIGQPK